MSPTDINTRCTTALRALEGAGVIESAWLPGMRQKGAGLGYAQRLDVRGFRGVGPWYGFHGHSGDEWSPHDLSDPVTAASLIVLVREAWGESTLSVMPCWWGSKLDGWYIANSSEAGHGPELMSFDVEDSEVEALVAALEAKVREVCGG